MKKAKFSNKTKQAIIERDGFKCIICECFQNFAFDIHHIYFGTESNYGENRNAINQGVTLCRDCHNSCHSCSKGEGVRQKCIDYINNL